MTVHMVFNCVKLLNLFPVKGGLPYSPKSILAGEIVKYEQYSLPFGTYCQVHENDEPRNSMVARTQGAICLGGRWNVQGGYLFLSLNTGRVITRYSYTILPMPQSVIDRINVLGADQPTGISFHDRFGRDIGDVDANFNSSGDETDITGVYEDVDTPQNETASNDFVDDSNVPADDVRVHNNAESVEFEPSFDNNQEIAMPDTEESIAVNPPMIESETVEPRRSTRERKPVSSYIPSMTGSKYAYAVTQLCEDGVVHPDAHTFVQDEFFESDPAIFKLVMTQISLKNAIKLWGEDARSAAQSEIKQLHWRDSFQPIHRRDLTEKEKAMILESHMFVIKKRDGKIKAREVAGGNKQRGFIEKEDASSPTVATESVLLTCTIDAMENRDVCVVDIPNAFIQTRVENKKDQTINRIRGELVTMLVDIAPDVYSDFVEVDKRGNKQLIVRCLNALYGTMVASLLFYKKFTKILSERDFKMNPYDPCVWNKNVNGKQLTICFHVDDCKISHVDSKVLDDTIEWLRDEFESVFEDGSGKMKVHQGKVLKYLGMTLDFSKKKKVKVSMFDYVHEIISAWDAVKEMKDREGFNIVLSKKNIRTCAAPENLFKVDESASKLSAECATAFHHIVAKALYITKRARPDICVAIAFLTTRVREPDVDDWRKLHHLICYLRVTEDLKLTLSANGLGVLKWYVDSSYAVHPNMRGQTGGGLTLGKGFPIVSSVKQKLNTRSSTESELVGVHEMMPSILWTRNFLNSQGYTVKDNILYQDNKSAILLEKNGRVSSSKRTKHIDVRYFFVTDRIQRGEVTPQWCPTGEMVADFMTKPLQGKAFTKFRDIVMGMNTVSWSV